MKACQVTNRCPNVLVFRFNTVFPFHVIAELLENFILQLSMLCIVSINGNVSQNIVACLFIMSY